MPSLVAEYARKHGLPFPDSPDYATCGRDDGPDEDELNLKSNYDLRSRRGKGKEPRGLSLDISGPKVAPLHAVHNPAQQCKSRSTFNIRSGRLFRRPSPPHPVS
ncbi:hypothetical protein B0H19DRAFT_62289 [Mycena capillaripes]|nr:hypothetical protein B0H19DRAFT_62289 [Mycena capillaripes]